MPVTEIIAIGTELLLGEIQDTNTRAIARRLRDYGIDVFRASLVGDNPQRIAQAICDSAQRSQIIITTGGLGPTIDDPTRQAVAEAAGVELEFRPELWEQIQARFERMNRKATENNRRQAYIPAGSLAINNPVGTAPSFICTLSNGTIVVSLPGVPKEMEYLFENEVLPFLQKNYDLHEIILARVLHLSGMGESVVDELIGDLEAQANPTVGLAAHTGQVDIRITAKAEDEPSARKMIGETEKIIRQRIPKGIYGVDADTMENVVAQRLFAVGWALEVLHNGIDSTLQKRLSAVVADVSFKHTLPEANENAEINSLRDNVLLTVDLSQLDDRFQLTTAVQTPSQQASTIRYYASAPSGVQTWAANMSLDLLLHTLLPVE